MMLLGMYVLEAICLGTLFLIWKIFKLLLTAFSFGNLDGLIQEFTPGLTPKTNGCITNTKTQLAKILRREMTKNELERPAKI